jgi:hypothetical protein
MRGIRRSIEDGKFEAFRAAFLDDYLPEDRKRELELEGIASREAAEDLTWDTEHSVLPDD